MRKLRLPEVERRVGFKRTKIYELMAGGNFPQNHELYPGSHIRGWFETEIDAFVKGEWNGGSFGGNGESIQYQCPAISITYAIT